jgi:L-amino acid N-acyltransferase
MPDRMTIRPATAADLSAISGIYNESVRTATASWAYEPETLADRTAWFDAHQRDGLAVLVAEASNGKVAGWGSLSHFRERTGYRFTVENSVYVAPEAQGQGIGRQLLTALIDAARARGSHVIVAGMDALNLHSERLHAAQGFVHVGRLPQVGFKFDRWLDLVLMQLTLVPPPSLIR